MFNDFVRQLKRIEEGEIPEQNKTMAETEEMVSLIRKKLTNKNYDKLFSVMRS